METVYGFKKVAEGLIEERNSLALQFEHEATGARVLVVRNDDENKAFVISFATPPEDSTGVAHILEHSVLCGSEKYPVKEPFIELLKGSLQTFLNAFTGSVETYYPVASQNRTDLYNLMGVYLDAVFFPRLTPEVLQQEGWRLEVSEDGSALTYKGVVFNEMKGAHASADRELYEHLERSLLADTPYQFDSGGAPRHIPELTWDYFQNFHKRYYHPTNSLTVIYGDDHSDEPLRLLDSYFSRFERGVNAPEIPLQPHFPEPRTLQVHLPGDRADESEAKIAIGWLLTDQITPRDVLVHKLLSDVLVGTAASPLRQKLMASGLVKDAGGGFSQERQISFILSLKGVVPDTVGQVQDLVVEILSDLRDTGVPGAAVEAALNTLEFGLRESNTGSFPRGLALAFDSIGGWRYGEDPIERLRFEQVLQSIREESEAGGFFEALIGRTLIDNTHKVTVIGRTDPELTKRQEDEEIQGLSALRTTLSEVDLDSIRAANERRAAWQDTPDSKEALAALPSLGLEDLDRKIRTIPTETRVIDGVTLHTHDLFTNGIVYVNLAFDLNGLPFDVLPYTKLLCRSLREMGTRRRSYIDLLQEIGKSTGGISIGSMFTVTRDGARSVAKLVVRAKATAKQLPELVGLLQEILAEPNLTDETRFRTILNEENSRLVSSIIPAGSRYAEARLRSLFHSADHAEELAAGLAYVAFIKALCAREEGYAGAALEGLRSVYAHVIRRSGLAIDITADHDLLDAATAAFSSMASELPDSSVSQSPWTARPAIASEGITVPSPVNFVASASNLYKYGYQWTGAVDSITRYINTVWLWEQVRVRGGAYGGAARFDPSTGVLTFSSYRDPNLDATLGLFKETGKVLSGLELDREELVRLTIGTIGGLDSYQMPDAKGYTAFMRILIGDTDADRQRRRDEVLNLKNADFREFGRVLSEAFAEPSSLALASRETLEQSALSNEPGFGLVELL